MIRFRRLLACATCIVTTGLHAAEITVFAAASLTEALTEAGKAYEASNGGEALRFNFAASSTLARQIKEGAPADVFFSADEARLDDLETAALLVPGSRRTLISNTLALVVRRDFSPPVRSISDLARPEVTRLALAEPSTVPAGIYAKAHLQKLGLWDGLSQKIVSVENVRAALAAVAAGNADAAFVYKTDALIARNITVAVEVPKPDGPAIAYPLALIKGGREPDAARKFATFLASPEALAIFVRHGFLPAP